MYKLYINLFLSFLAIFSLILPVHVQAGKDDFSKEVKIAAQRQFADGKRRVSIFRGDVEISQGSLHIKADEVETDASRGDGKEILVARGKPASYSQTTDDGSTVKALANEISYDVNTRILTLKGAAEVYQNTSMVKGESIVYNMEQEQLIAEGSDNTEGRVTTIFRPDTNNNDTQTKDVLEPAQPSQEK